MDDELARAVPGRRTQVVLVAVVIAALAAGVAAWVLRQPDPVDRLVAGPAAQDPRQLATERARSLVDGLAVPGGAREVDGPPAPRLQTPASIPVVTWLVTATRFFVLEEDLSTAVDFFARSEQEGQALTGKGQVAQSGRVLVRSLGFGELQLELAPLDGGRTALRADAQVRWHPARTAQQEVGQVDGAQVSDSWSAAGQPLHAVTLTRVDAQRLADLVDGLAMADPGPRSCPPDDGYRRWLTFQGLPGETTVTVAPCGLNLRRDAEQVELDRSMDLDTALETWLGSRPTR